MRNYFKGWYFKQHSGKDCIALIPAIHIQTAQARSASIQIITNHTSHCIEYPFEAFSQEGSPLNIKIGSSTFSSKGMNLDIRSPEISVKGIVHFGPLTPIRYDIMGPFRFVPFMECRHGVISMVHSVNGRIAINGRECILNFANGSGYIESDRGTSFPKQYIWTQCIWQDETLCSLMLSAADIPFLGSSFTGIIGIIYWRGKEFRIATYLGARMTHLSKQRITVRQGKYTFSAEQLDQNVLTLRAPVSGNMKRLIRENPSCHARYRFWVDDKLLFDFISDMASFEYEYDKSK